MLWLNIKEIHTDYGTSGINKHQVFKLIRMKLLTLKLFCTLTVKVEHKRKWNDTVVDKLTSTCKSTHLRNALERFCRILKWWFIPMSVTFNAMENTLICQFVCLGFIKLDTIHSLLCVFITLYISMHLSCFEENIHICLEHRLMHESVWPF